MRRENSELLKKLCKYSKEDIIKAIGAQFNSDYLISSLLTDLEHKATQKALDDHETAIDALISAREAFSKWRTEMCVKYGDGKTVKLSTIPHEEINRGAALEKALMKATEVERKLGEKVNKILKEGYS